MNLVPIKYTKIHGDKITNIFYLNNQIITTSMDGTIRAWDSNLEQKSIYFNDLNYPIEKSWIGIDNRIYFNLKNTRILSYDVHNYKIGPSFFGNNLIFYDGKYVYQESDCLNILEKEEIVKSINFESKGNIKCIEYSSSEFFFIQNNQIFTLTHEHELNMLFKGEGEIQNFYILKDDIFIIYKQKTHHFKSKTLLSTLEILPKKIIKVKDKIYMIHQNNIYKYDLKLNKIYQHPNNIENFLVLDSGSILFNDSYQPNLIQMLNESGTLEKKQKHEGAKIQKILMNEMILVHYPYSIHMKIGSKLEDYFEILQQNGKVYSKWKIERKRGFKQFDVIKDELMKEKGFYFDYKSDISLLWIDSFQILIWSEHDTAKILDLFGNIKYDYEIIIEQAFSSNYLYMSRGNELFIFDGKKMINKTKFKQKIEKILVNNQVLFLFHTSKITMMDKDELIEIEIYDEIQNIFYIYSNLIYITKSSINENGAILKNIWRDPIPLINDLLFRLQIQYIEKNEDKDSKEIIHFGSNSFGIYQFKPSLLVLFHEKNLKHFILKDEKILSKRNQNKIFQ